MTAVNTIERVLSCGILCHELTVVPKRGATISEVSNEESLLGKRLRPDHIAILRRWNGIALEVVRLFGCGDDVGRVGRLADFQLNGAAFEQLGVAIGSDASGFMYFQDASGVVRSYDADGGNKRIVATSLDDFIDRVAFGSGADEFAGAEWLNELRSAGLVT